MELFLSALQMAHHQQIVRRVVFGASLKRVQMHFYAKKAPNSPMEGFRDFRNCDIIGRSMRKMRTCFEKETGKEWRARQVGWQGRRPIHWTGFGHAGGQFNRM